MARQEYPSETKAAIMAALLTGQSIGSIARDYNVPASTIRSWKSRESHSVASVATEKKEEIGDLLIHYLRSSLAALRKQAEVFGDTEWLKKQPASELAVLHGVITDKAVRLLEALADSDGEIEQR
jgi:transposase-like protein